MKRFTLISLLLLLVQIGFGQTVEDERTVIQMSIDLPAIQSYYLEETPLIIADEGVVPATLNLAKFGEPVEFMIKTELFFLSKKAFLEFDKFEITSSQAEVVFKYAVKGLTVSLSFEKEEGTWLLEERTITVE